MPGIRHEPLVALSTEALDTRGGTAVVGPNPSPALARFPTASPTADVSPCSAMILVGRDVDPAMWVCSEPVRLDRAIRR